MGRWKGIRPSSSLNSGKIKNGMPPDGQAKSPTIRLDRNLGLATPRLIELVRVPGLLELASLAVQPLRLVLRTAERGIQLDSLLGHRWTLASPMAQEAT